MALIFQFSVETRARETGVLLGLGFSARSVRALLWGEGLLAAACGAPLGALGGLLYARALLAGLSSNWQGAVGGVYLLFHVEPLSPLIGCAATIAAAALAIYFAVRKQASRPARELLNERGNAVSSASTKIRAWKITGVVGLFGAAGLIALGFSRSGPAAAGLFFGSGALLLVAALAFVRWLLVENSAARYSAMPSLSALGIRAAKRKPGRSLAVAALLAIGSFLVCAIGVNELDANADSSLKTSGTGGFALFARATIPVFDDLNSTAGRKKLGLDSKLLDGVSIYPLRVKLGDEASCLNLNRAQTPRILGAPKAFLLRGGFTFVKTSIVEPERFKSKNSWEIALQHPLKDSEIPAVCDAQSLQWALHLNVGDALNVNDEHGAPHAIKFVGAVANSILQGSIVISEEDFLKLYPSESGYRYFLIDVAKQEREPSPLTPAFSPKGGEGERQRVADYLANALSDNGLEVQSTASRLAEYNAVQNTYLATFQALGALGMLLGSLGLGLVVLRNMLERRSELAMLRVLGFSRGGIIKMILAEHVWLLSLGLLAGGMSALAAIAPTLSLSAGAFPWRSMSVTLLGIFAVGLFAAAVGARSGMRSAILEGLKSE